MPGHIFALIIVVFSTIIFSLPQAGAGVVEFKDNMLNIDGESQPQLFGAELQYFRLRGGAGRNIPRDTVIELWNKALDRLVEMRANSISFYIPWDFHEYAPGKFDFTGTVDEDGDGNPDYPSRDLKTFLTMIEEHGIRIIMVRPGPYINAEWGFLGFGAVPLWFHEKYPNSHMRNAKGQRTPLFSYSDPDFLRESKIWMKALYTEVLINWIGPEKPVSFLQLDNETNFQWGSIYTNDYGALAIRNYRDGLKASYKTIAKLNAVHHRTWKTWSEILAPVVPGANLAEDQDWYRFQDQSIHTFLMEIRKTWESLGVKEPNVLFTLAESYNSAKNGMLPNYQLRNDKGQTGLMTVNLYPKTSGDVGSALLNNPFKADHDVKAADSANDYYFGQKQEWVMGPEIQGGWWKGTDVTDDARTQTYLTTIGHGMKSLFVYYFNEGENWQHDWAFNEVQADFDRLKLDPRFASLPADQLPDLFWTELNTIFADRVFAGWDVRAILANGGIQSKELYFDAPLDGNANPRPHFDALKDIGTKLVEPYGRFLASATEMTDPVCFVKDVASNVPSELAGIDSSRMNSDWAGGLIGYLLQVGINPKILHWGLTPISEFAGCKLLIHQDNGFASPTLVAMLKKHLASGGAVLNFLGDDLLMRLAPPGSATKCSKITSAGFDLDAKKCVVGSGIIYQSKTLIYENFNSDAYAEMKDVPARSAFLNAILGRLKIVPRLKVLDGDHGADRIVAFGRAGPDGRKILITVKNGRDESAPCRVRWSEADPKQAYAVSRLMEGSLSAILGTDLATKGFIAGMKPRGSDVFVIEPIGAPNGH